MPAAGTETASFAAEQNFRGAVKTEILIDAKVLLRQRDSGWPGAFAAAQIMIINKGYRFAK